MKMPHIHSKTVGRIFLLVLAAVLTVAGTGFHLVVEVFALEPFIDEEIAWEADEIGLELPPIPEDMDLADRQGQQNTEALEVPETEDAPDASLPEAVESELNAGIPDEGNEEEWPAVDHEKASAVGSGGKAAAATPTELHDILATSIGGPGLRDLENVGDLGDRYHYNGIIFGDMTSYQADSEGALAVGGSAYFGKIAGYDIGASYEYSKYVHIGEYTNPENRYPTLLLGGSSLKIGLESGTTTGHFNVYGGPVVMSQALYQIHETLQTRFTLMPELDERGSETNIYYDMVIAKQSELNAWFQEQKASIVGESQMYQKANNVTITVEELSTYSDFYGKKFTWIDQANSKAVNPYLNQNLLNSSGDVADNVLVINVVTDPDVNFSGNYVLPVSAEWAQKYKKIIYNFPNAVNVTMSGDPQIIADGVGSYDKNYPNGHLSTAQSTERNSIAQRTLYSFPIAENIKMSTVLLLGTLMAPGARVEANGGSINGQLLCEEFETKGGMELHALHLTRDSEPLYPPESDDGYLSVKKYAAADGTPLAGAEFILVLLGPGGEEYYDGSGGFVALESGAAIYRTGDDGTATITGVPVGTYLLRETKAPDGYQINREDPLSQDTYFEVEVRVESRSAVVEISRSNEPQMRDLHFRKVDSQDHDRMLENAVFALFYQQNDGSYIRLYQDITSGPQGDFRLEGLLPGKYELREVASPEGYQIVGDGILPFEIYADGQGELQVHLNGGVEGNGSKETPILVENTDGVPDNSIYIYKYQESSSGNSTALPGAKFALYREIAETPGIWEPVVQNDDSDDPAAIAIETDASGLYLIQKLLPGTYRLVETEAPAGYYRSNPHPEDSLSGSFPDGYAWEFSVTEEELYQMISLSNRPRHTAVLVDKVDADTGTAIPGAVFTLYREDPDGEWAILTSDATDSSGMVWWTNLAEGRYRLEETAPPPGYNQLEPGSIYFSVTLPEREGDAVLVIATLGEGGEEQLLGSDSRPVSVVLGEMDDAPLIHFGVENKAGTRDLGIFKIDRDVYQEGVDEDEGRTYLITYLEGAGFRLQRRDDGGQWRDYGTAFTTAPLYQTDEEGVAILDEDGSPLPIVDQYGNPVAKASLQGLIAGTYRLVETAYPQGYRPEDDSERVVLEDTTTGYVVHTFTITNTMVEEGGESLYTITNISDKPRSDLRIYKQDSQGNPIPLVPFKLWKVSEGAESWDGAMTLEEVLADFSSLKFVKYSTPGGSSSFFTDSSGMLRLEGIEPGVYVLFEHWNENITEYLRSVLYLLSHETTIAEPDDPSFYYHLTAFKVVAVDESNPDLGVRIQWVDRNKLWNGEVVFNNAANNTESWTQPADESEYRSITVVNKILEEVDLTFRKVGDEEPATALEGAVFTLYEKTSFAAENGDMSAYRQVDTATSGGDGAVSFTGLGASWKKTDGSEVEEGYRVRESDAICAEYMVLETAPPAGYRASSDPIYFRLELDPLSKMLDFLLLDAQGNTLARYAGYADPENPDDPGAMGSFYTQLALWDQVNQRVSDFRFRKVAGITGEALTGAAFSLYRCEEHHAHSLMAAEEGSCWLLYRTAESDSEGLVLFQDLPSGEYRLVETAAPEGYRLPEGQWRLDVDAKRSTIDIQAVGTEAGHAMPPAFLSVNGEQDNEADYWLPNRNSYSLPITGGVGAMKIYTVGSALVGGGATLWAHWITAGCRRRKRKK